MSGSPDGTLVGTFRGGRLERNQVSNLDLYPDNDVFLDPETKYWFVIQRTDARVGLTDSANQDAGSQADWNIGERSQWKQGSSFIFSQEEWAIQLGIHGTEREPPPGPAVLGVPDIAASPANGRWSVGDTVEVTLAFHDIVTIDTREGTPYLEVALGEDATRRASYVRGTGTPAPVFAYTLAAQDGTHLAVGVTANSLALNGGTIRDETNVLDAELEHEGATAAGVMTLDPVTAAFRNGPETHDGYLAFDVELWFAPEPYNLSYRTVGSSLLTATNARVERARRITRHNDSGWYVTIAPTAREDITLAIAAQSITCSDPATICTSAGAPLHEDGATVIIPASAPPDAAQQLTATLTSDVTEHDGSSRVTARLTFSEEVTLGYRNITYGVFDYQGADVVSAVRAVRGSNMAWDITVAPLGNQAIRMELVPYGECPRVLAVCTPDGRAVSNAPALTIPGPAGLSVADASVDEGADATLDFVVTLDRARTASTTVQYATSDGTATQGVDYTAASGTLTFATGETTKTVAVTVLDDGHDEGNETMTLTLSNPSGALLTDATATGTIRNSDPMPKAWAVRFGRTVASQVVDALGRRLDNAGGRHLTVGGVELGTGHQPAPLEGERDVDPMDLVHGTSFRMTGGDGGWGEPVFGVWGETAYGAFDGRESNVSFDGGVTTGVVGADAGWSNALAGVMVSYSRGGGSYRLKDAQAAQESAVEGETTGLYPYARLRLNDRISAWATVGAGSGEMTLEQAEGKTMPTDLTMRMGAAGMSGRILDGGDPSGIGLTMRTDALWVKTDTAKTADMVATQGESTRLRATIEGQRTLAMAGGRTLSMQAQAAVRHDGGDAETGAGVEVGAGTLYSAGRLRIGGNVRSLLAHEADGYRDWGASATLQLAPEDSGRGLSITVQPGWGRTQSDGDRIWYTDRPGLGSGGRSTTGHVDIETVYGFRFGSPQGTLSPYAGAAMRDGSGAMLRAGARWASEGRLSAEMGAKKREEQGGSDTEVELKIKFSF